MPINITNNNSSRASNARLAEMLCKGEHDYLGQVNQAGLRYGQGSYGWRMDSIYIGHWEDGLMTGYGLMYYYKSGKSDKSKHGIWRYNQLVKPYPPLNSTTLYRRVDSVQTRLLHAIIAE